MAGEEQTLLEAFIVDNQDLERLEALLAEFNIFEAVGVVRHELRHSDFLAFLLDPAQNHGLDDIFLKRLLKRVLIDAGDPPLSPVEIDVADLRTAEIRREWRNIDILIHDSANRLVGVVENKIGTTEHSAQLSRYRQIVKQEFHNHRAIFIYLTPEGDEPSDPAYIPFSYTRIVELIDKTCKTYKSTLKPDVYMMMTHYTTMLRRHIVSDSEIAELCQRIYRRHKRALDLIFEHRPDLQLELAELLKQLILNDANAHKLTGGGYIKKGEINFNDTEWSTFSAQLKAHGWSIKDRLLVFTFQNTSNQLVLKLYIRPLGVAPIQKAIHQFALSHPTIFRGASRHFSQWTTIYKRQFLASTDYEDADLENLTKKVQAEWQKFLNDDLPTIRQALAEIKWP